VIYSFTGGNDGWSSDAAVIQASDGNLYGTTAQGGWGGQGAVFEISNPTTSPTESAIYSFTGSPTDGNNPLASVIQASDGNLYGTTPHGGSSGFGTVFEISNPTTFPTESVIYSFGNDGANPQVSLIQASDGNLYGTTAGGGGQSAWGTLFKISDPTTSPTETVIYRFTGGSDGGSPNASLIQASDGNLYGTTYNGGLSGCYFGCGTAFKITSPTTSPTFSVIYSFTGGNDAYQPNASLIQASDGNLYGTTFYGGSSDHGTIFKISNPTTSPTESVIYSFTGAPDGNGPRASLIQGSDGSLYGTTVGGGSSDSGTVFKISNPTTSPAESVIYSFAGGTDGSYPYAAVIQASDGSLYGTTVGGGSSYSGTVFRIANPSTTPIESVIYSFPGAPDGKNPKAAVIQASDGNLYGTTELGGLFGCTSDYGCGTVFKISNPTTSPVERVIHRFAPGSDGAFPDASLIQASDGNLYGTTNGGGSANAGTAFRITQGVCPTITIAPNALPNATLNLAYSQPVSASGGVAPYTYSVSAGALPTGLSLDGATGDITGTPTATGSFSFDITATDNDTCVGSTSYAVSVNVAGQVVRFFTIAPCRLIDTRRTPGTYGGPELQGGGAQRSFPVDGQCGVPGAAVAISANVTVVGATGGADLRIFSSGTPTPTVSSINFNAGQTRANNAILPMVGNPVGSITVQCDIPSGTTNMLLDINGYFQ
jgi:uncharacterized repeat protein (TIGR03803 family)